MASGFSRKRPPEAAAPVTPQFMQPAVVEGAANVSEGDSAREILELLELELGAMIRPFERAAHSVAGSAEATAATLSTIRQRTDALTGRTSAAQRSYLIQSYARDMGNGKTVMMREIDVPIRVQRRHWGGFRTAYKL
jgi:methyl-accepting chemotaxis protein